jgi:phosphate transport system substrate-binding protein
MKRNSKKKKLLRSVILSFFLLVCILLLSYPYIHANLSQDPNPQNCSPRQIKDVAVPALQLVPFSGSTTFASLNDPNAKNKDSLFTAIQNAHPQFRLQYVDPAKQNDSPGSSIGIKWLIEDMHNLRFALSSRRITNDEFKTAEQRKVSIISEPIAYDIMAFYVSSNLTEKELKGLTITDVQKIFTGEITNWNQVKGPDRKITPFLRNFQSSGTVEFFKERVLKNKEFGQNIHPIGSNGLPKEQITTLAIRNVASNSGGISYATASELINQKTIRIIPIAKQDTPVDFVSPCTDKSCKAVDTSIIAKQSYPAELIRQLYVIIKQDGKTDQKAGEAYVNMLKSCEGEKFLKQAGFVPRE